VLWTSADGAMRWAMAMRWPLRRWVCGGSGGLRSGPQYFYPILVKDAGQYSGKDGSGLKLTVAKYLTPARQDIARDGGLLPDVRCDDHPRSELASDACMEQAAAYVTSHAREREQAVPPTPNGRARDV